MKKEKKMGTDIEEIEARVRGFLKTEYRTDALYRVAVVTSQIGDIAKFVYHSPENNPNARSVGTREDEISIYGEAMVHLIALMVSREIDIVDAIETGMERLDDKDGYKKTGKIAETAVATVVKGISASPGIVQGRAIVMQSTSARDLERLSTVLDDESEIILVTESLTPDSVSFLRAMNLVGIVTNQGGHASHGAKIAKELGIPCVSGTEKATERIKSNDTIIVDGDKGEIVLRNMEEKA